MQSARRIHNQARARRPLTQHSANSSSQTGPRNPPRTRAKSSEPTLDGPRTLFDKIWDEHLVAKQDDGTCLVYIDRHLVHEVTSPQAFEGLRTSGRDVRRPDCTLATADHNVPTEGDRSQIVDIDKFIGEEDSRTQVSALNHNVEEFGLTYYGLGDSRQGIVHVIGPEQGFTLPGTTVVCGDSHTSTHGAFGALAFGIGTSEVEHVLATQTLLMPKPKNMRVKVDGPLGNGVTAKDIILHVIGEIGTAGGTGHVIEYCGETIENLSIEARMSLCNMTIEAGARAGLVAPDEKTLEYLRRRPMVPKEGSEWDRAADHWRALVTDKDAHFDRIVRIDATEVSPTVTWGTSPQDVAPVDGTVPDPEKAETESRRRSMLNALEYQGISANSKISEIGLDKVFIGSCTNARIEDLRLAAAVAKGKRKADGVDAFVVPGSGLVKLQAEEEGLAEIFKQAGFEWRNAGCSMCLAMNPDKLLPEERCASTSNRNFEGRQGFKGRTHLVSPAMASAAAVHGHFVDVRDEEVDTAVFSPEGEGNALARMHDGAPPKPVARGGKGKSEGGEAKGKEGMEKFRKVQGIAAPLELSNVDTDQIIPKQFLKTIKRSGLGVSLFHDMRYGAEGEEKPEFVLNVGKYRNAKILVCGENFGCGSSREHAPWALKDFGISVILAPSFADIFQNNCLKNGLLPISLAEEEHCKCMLAAKRSAEISVDLERCEIATGLGDTMRFEVEDFPRRCLLEGLDDIGLTMERAREIDDFEKRALEERPWVFNAACDMRGQADEATREKMKGLQT